MRMRTADLKKNDAAIFQILFPFFSAQKRIGDNRKCKENYKIM